MGAPDQARGRRAAVLSVVVLAFLVGHNLYWLVRNQGELPPNDRPHRSPRDLEEVARQGPMSKIYGQMATYYHLAKRIPGASVTVTPRVEPERWFFERVARLQVTSSPVRLVIPPKSARRLRALTTAKGSWRVPTQGGRHRTIELNFHLDPTVDAYVLAERSDGRELFFLPAAEYATVAGRP
jgi:hypothetical protein